MLVIELRHIESETGLTITEQNCARALANPSLLHASRTDKEQYGRFFFAGMLQPRQSGCTPELDLIDCIDCLIFGL